MALTFGSTTERRKGYKAGTNLTGNAPAAPSAPVLGAIAAQSGNIKRVAITTFPANANYITREISINGGAYASAGASLSPGTTYFDCDVGSATSWSFRSKAGNAGGESAYSAAVSGSSGSGGGVTPPATGISFELQALRSQIDSLLANQGFTGWQSDSTGGFARIQWDGGNGQGVRGLRYTLQDRTKRIVYVRFWMRQSRLDSGSKTLKIFGQGYPTTYSNFTFGNGYGGNSFSFNYGDVEGSNNDNSVGFEFDGFPKPWATLPAIGNGSSFTRTPYPTKRYMPGARGIPDTYWHEYEYGVVFTETTPDGQAFQFMDGELLGWIDSAWIGSSGMSLRDIISLGDISQSPAQAFNQDFKWLDVGFQFPRASRFLTPRYATNFSAMTVGAAPVGPVFIGVDADSPNAVVVASDQVYSGNKSLKIHYDAAGTAVSEAVLDLGTNMTELEIEFALYVPSNYAHGPGSFSSATNNKFFRIGPTLSGLTSDIQRFGASFNRVGTTQYSSMNPEWDENDGIGMDARGGSYQDFITAGDLGKWMRVAIHCKSPTAKGSGKGFIRIYKNESPVCDVATDNFSSGGNNFMRYAYLFGATNAKFSQSTDFYISNFVVRGA